MYIAVCGSCDMTLNGERSCALFDDSVERLGKMWGENGEVRRTWFLGEGEAKFYYKNIIEGFLRIFYLDSNMLIHFRVFCYASMKIC